MTTGLDRPARTPDEELEALFDDARTLSERPAARETVDWIAVRRSVRNRRAARVALVALVVVAAASTVTFFAVRPGAAGGPHAATPPPMVVLAPAGIEELRFLRLSPRVEVFAEPTAVLRAASASSIALEAGTVWVRVDSAHGPVPFAVGASDASVSVVGTRFAVRAAPGAATEVAVWEGRVRVAAGGRDVLVAAGQELRAGTLGAAPASTAWRTSLASVFGSAETDGAPAAPADDALPPPSPPSAAAPATPPAEPAAGEEDLAGHDPASPAADAGPSPQPGTPPPDASEASPAEELYARAEQAMAEGRTAKAVELLEEVARLEPGSSIGGAAWMDLGARLQQLGRDDDAARAYRRYLAEQPGGAFRGEARIALCRLEGKRGAAAEARACYAAYLDERPTGPYAAEARSGSGPGGSVE